MDSSFQPGPLMAHTYSLPRGVRVRLRLATPRDEGSIRDLFERSGAPSADLDIARMVRFDPRRRAVICAMTLIGSFETVVGIGTIEFDQDEPSLLVVDDELSDGLGELLSVSLRALRSARAA